jgi:hypothetical protein
MLILPSMLRFNYRDKTWQATAGLPQCVTNDARFDSKIDPDDVKILNILEEKLEERFRESRTRFTIIYDKWTRSGNNDADNFYSFCNGDKINHKKRTRGADAFFFGCTAGQPFAGHLSA